MKFNPYENPAKPPRPKQKECFKLIDKNRSVLANLWTGYGKTWVALYLAQKTVNNKKKFMITCPLRALVDQLTTECSPYFNTLAVSGDYRNHKSLLFDPEYQGFCLTYEMAYTKIINPSQRRLLFEDIGAIIIDEIQTMSDPGRGAVIESLILLLQHFYPQIQLLLMSATLGNAVDFALHFNLSLVRTTEKERPVPLEKEIIEIQAGKSKDSQFNAVFHAICRIINDYPQSSSEMPTMLVFCESRWLSKHLAKEIPKRYSHIKCDYHNAGRTKKDRTKIEQKFQKGELNMVFCTPTLAMGINVPCDITILTAVSRWNPLTNRSEMLESNEIIQKIGRAGRPGMKARLFQNGKQYGKAYIFCKSDERQTVEQMIDEPLQISSQIPNNLKYILLTWVCAGITEINKLKEIYHHIFISQVDDSLFFENIQWLQEKFFLRRDENGQLSLSHSGRIVSYFAIQPETALHLLRMKKQIHSLNFSELNPTDLFVILLATSEFTDNIRTDSSEDREKFMLTNQFIHSQWIYDHFGQSKYDVIQIESVKKAFALVFHEYLNLRYQLDPTKTIPKLNFEPGDLSILQGILQRILAAAVALLGTNWHGGKLLYWLAKGVEQQPAVIDSDVVDLMQVDGIGIKTAIVLMESKISNRHILAAQNPHHLAVRLKSMIYSRNQALHGYCQRMEITYRGWRAPAEKTLTNIIQKLQKSPHYRPKSPNLNKVINKNRKQKTLPA